MLNILVFSWIPVPRAGRYKVELFPLHKKLLLSVLLEGTAEPFHPWMPFDHPLSLAKLERGGASCASPRTSLSPLS